MVKGEDSFRSSDSRRIRTAWQALPEIRADVVERARKALASGEYASREIAERTAARIASEMFRTEGRLG